MDKYGHIMTALGGSSEKPKKEIKEMHVRKSHNGGHIITHKHHAPEHHPDEEHTTHGDDAMVEHMMQHAGTPNPGEAASEPDAASAMQGSAPMTASPSPAGSGAPAAGAAPMAGM